MCADRVVTFFFLTPPVTRPLHTPKGEVVAHALPIRLAAPQQRVRVLAVALGGHHDETAVREAEPVLRLLVLVRVGAEREDARRAERDGGDGRIVGRGWGRATVSSMRCPFL